MKNKIIVISILSSILLVGCASHPTKPNYDTYKNAKVIKVENSSCLKGCNPNIDLKIGKNKISVKAKSDIKPLLQKGNIVNVKVDSNLYVREVKLSDSKEGSDE